MPIRANQISATICIIIFCATLLRAQEGAVDTTKGYHHPAVVVVGSRLLQRSASTLASVTSVGQSTLRRLEGRSIDAVLSDEAGLFVRDIGGPGGVKTASIRGSAANQTVVLFNGIRLNSMQNGLADLGLLPVELFNSVEVVRGGQSALYGPDAISGAILLSTGLRRGTGGRFSLRVGSFKERGISGMWNVDRGDLTFAFRAGVDAVEGAFPFRWASPDGMTTYKRHGASLQRYFSSVTAAIQPNSSFHIEGSFVGVLADRGSPGPVTPGGWTHARLRDGLFLGSLRFFHLDASPSSWEGGISGTYQNEEYRVEDNASIPVDRYLNRATTGWWHWRRSMSPSLSAGWGLEMFHASLSGSAFSAGTRRSGGGLMIHLDWIEPSSGLRFLPTVRWDMFSDIAPQASPRLALELPLREDGALRLRASVGGGFRMPSFNELYWKPGGNPALRHERSFSSDAGAEIRAAAWGDHRIVGGVFAAETRDRITGWPPLNITRSFTHGFEWSWSWSFEGHRLWWSGTWSSVELREPGLEGHQLPFMPRQVFTGGMDLAVGSFTVSPVITYQSRRFTTVENSFALSIAPSARVSVASRWEGALLGVPCGLQLSVENLFDVSDLALPGYPLPGRSVTFRTSFTLDSP